MPHVIKNHKSVQAKSRRHKVWFAWEDGVTGMRQYGVRSGDSDQVYTVKVTEAEETFVCSCEWGGFKRWDDPRTACSHSLAVDNFRQKEEKGRESSSAWATLADALRQHRPHRDIGDGTIVTSRARGT